jgi:hypothetical protein
MTSYKEKISAYLPGVLLFVAALVIGLLTYKDYGMAWDEPTQRGPGLLSYEYAFHGSQALFHDNVEKFGTATHGAGFEVLLVIIEKGLKLSDPKDIYEMRHLVTHLLFLLSALAIYILVQRLFKNKLLSSLAFLVLMLSPRMYAHSFFNSKDIPFLSMIVIALALCQAAFEKNKPALYLLLGLACGYATSIRIMGLMLFSFILLFLVIDLVFGLMKKDKPTKYTINLLLFTFGFCFLFYVGWPYIWKHPVEKLLASFSSLSHFEWKGAILFKGEVHPSDKPLPLSYFPTWFLISNPILWLLAGFAGLVWTARNFFKQPMAYIQNTRERIFLLFALCFAVPIFAVLFLHSVIYDDWRHLYFVYPPFILLGIYLIAQFINGKYKYIMLGACGVQVLMLGGFIMKNHPFSQVYFNELVSHDEEFLRKNYDLEYWGCSFKQALEYITTNDTAKTIKVCCIHKSPLDNNILMLPEPERKRIVFEPEAMKADYFITNFRLHPDDFPSTNIAYEIQVQNSTIMRIYKMHK